jgi:hypothetical protein
VRGSASPTDVSPPRPFAPQPEGLQGGVSDGREPATAWTTTRKPTGNRSGPMRTSTETQTVCHWFAKSPCIAGNPRALPFVALARNQPICRAFLDLPKTQLLIAMQKVVGSSPIGRFGSTCKSAVYQLTSVGHGANAFHQSDTERTVAREKSARPPVLRPQSRSWAGLSRSLEVSTL